MRHDLNFYTTIGIEYKHYNTFVSEAMKELDTYVGTKAQIVEKEQQLQQQARDNYNAHIQSINDARLAKRELFKQHLAEHYFVIDNPKLDMLFDIVWDRCSDDGPAAVKEEFEEFVTLIC